MSTRKKRMLSGLLAMAMAASWLGGVPAAAAGPETGETLYQNGFEDPASIAAWTNPGSYAVENGVLRAENGGGALCLSAPEGVTGGDYIVSAKVTVDAVNMEDGSSAGLLFRAAGEKDFFHFRINASNMDGEDAQLYQNSGGSMSKLTEPPFDWEAGTTYTLTASAQGGHILCYVDGTQVIDYTDSDYSAETAASGVGFRIWGCGVSFDDLAVSTVSGPAVTVTVPLETVTAMPMAITGTAEGGSSVTVTVKSGEETVRTITVPVADGAWSCATYLPGGTYTAQVTGVSAGGHGVSQPVVSQAFTVELAPAPLTAALEQDVRVPVELSLNGLWAFAADPDDVGQAQGWYTLENTEGWDTLPVPGNWDLENDYANYKGTGWYGRTFDMPAEYEGYPAYLNLTAVYHDSRIWINGREVGSHDGGYTTFEFRVDDYLN